MQSDQCITCAQLLIANTCKAFPDGIPYEIISGKHDHREPFEGDNGILWSQNPQMWKPVEDE